MPKDCPDCGTTLLPADDFDCDRANWICPDCAPDFVLMRATTYVDVDLPSDEWNDKW